MCAVGVGGAVAGHASVIAEETVVGAVSVVVVGVGDGGGPGVVGEAGIAGGSVHIVSTVVEYGCTPVVSVVGVGGEVEAGAGAVDGEVEVLGASGGAAILIARGTAIGDQAASGC